MRMFMLSEDAEFDRLGCESILHLSSGSSLALNDSGTLIVQGVVDGLPAEAIARSLSNEYDLDADAAVADTCQFLDRLAELGAVCEREALR